jgi:carbamoyl-phosphate synthase/aspartate carbamoyltransferase
MKEVIDRNGDKEELMPTIEALHKMGFTFYSTHRTHEFLMTRNIPSAMLHKISEPRSPNIKEYLENKRIDFVINIPTHSSSAEKTDGYFIRRISTDRGIPLITNVQLAKRIVEALQMKRKEPEESLLMPWPEMLHEKAI